MRKVWRVLMSTTMVMALLVGCGNNQSTEAVSEEQLAAEAAAAVEEAPATEPTIEAWGSVDAQTIKQIYIDFPATVTQVYVTQGQRIKEGDKLLSLNYEEYKLKISQKETELGLDKIQVNSSDKADTSSAKQIADLKAEATAINQRLANGTDTDILELQDQLKKSKDDLTQAETDLELAEQLLEAGSGSEDSVRVLKNKIATLKSDIGKTEQKITNTKKDKQQKVNTINTQIASLQDGVSNTKLTKNTAQTTYAIKEQVSNLEISQMKDKCVRDYIKGNDVISDIPSGVIKSISAVEGGKVGNDGSTVLEIIDTDSLVIKANVSEEFIKDVAIGEAVDIIPYADREKVFKGRVKEIQQMAVSNNGEVVIPIIIEAVEESPYLQYGYSVDVTIYKK